MPTIKLIFAGLISLGLVDDGGDGRRAVANLLDDEHHRPSLHLLKGTLRQEGSNAVDDGDCIERIDKEMRLAGQEILFRIDHTDPGSATIDVIKEREPGSAVPASEQEARDLSWIPSVDAHVLGRARLRRRCAIWDESCPQSRARFFLERGSASTCHLIHQDDTCGSGPGNFYTYMVPGMGRQAVGTAFEVAFEAMESPTLVVEVREANGEKDEVRCEMVASEEGEFTLVVVNEPPPTNDEVDCDPPERLGHHSIHYGLVNLFYGRWYRAVPNYPELMDSAPVIGGHCEDEIIAVSNRIWDDLQPPGTEAGANFPHSSGACDSSTLP